MNKSNCLEQKCELIMEKKMMTILKLTLNIKSIVGSQEMKKQNLLEKQIHVNLHEIQRNFHDSENNNNEEYQLIVKDTNIENNNNEDNRLRINGSNIENGIDESTVKSNKGKLALILGDSMVQDVDGYLLTGSINRKFIVKVKPFSSAKTINMEDYTKPTKRNFKPDLHILHAGTNDLSLDDTPEVISSCIIDIGKSLMTEKNKIIISNIIPRGDKNKEKGKILS